MTAFDAWLSRCIGNLISRYLGAYVLEFRPDQFSIRLFRGEIELTDVVIGKSTFEFLGNLIPWTIQYAKIGHLCLRIPLFNLMEEPLTLSVHKIHVALEAERFGKHREADRPTEPFAPVLQYIPEQDVQVPVEKSRYTSVMFRLLSMLAEHVSVKVSSTMITLRDCITNPVHPQELGLRIGNFVLRSCDDKGDFLVERLRPYRPTLRYAARLMGLRVAWWVPGHNQNAMDHLDEPFLNMDTPLLIEHENEIKVQIGIRLGTKDDHDEMVLDRSPKPFLMLSVNAIELKLMVVDEHMSFLWDLIHRIFWWLRITEVNWLRPEGRVRQGPRDWWQFARTAFIEELNTRMSLLGRTTWGCVLQAAERRRTYIRLYRRYLLASDHKLSASESLTLQKLDAGLDYECIRRFRSFVKRRVPTKPNFIHRVKALIENVMERFKSSPIAPSILRYTSLAPTIEAGSLQSPTGREEHTVASEILDIIHVAVDVKSIRAIIENQGRKSHAPDGLLDWTIVSVNAVFVMNAANMSATAVIGDVRARNDIDLLRLTRKAEGENVEEIHPTQLVYFQWAMLCEPSCTSTYLKIDVLQNEIHFPGVFIGRILLWIFPTTFAQAEFCNFWLVSPMLYATDAAQVQSQRQQKNYIPLHRIRVNSCTGPFLIHANTGRENGPVIHLAIGQVIVKCDNAKLDDIDMSRFPEFQSAVCVADGASVYDYMYASIDDPSISFTPGFLNSDLPLLHNPPRNEVLKIVSGSMIPQIQSPTMGTNPATTMTKFGKASAIEIDALISTSSTTPVPFYLIDGGIPPVKVIVSAGFYSAILYLIESILPPAPAKRPDTMIPNYDRRSSLDAERSSVLLATPIDDEEHASATYVEPLAGPSSASPALDWLNSGSRLLARVHSLEVVIQDRLADASLSVARVRLTSFKLHSIVKEDRSIKSMSRMQLEAWYFSHLVRTWEPILEPWIITFNHRMDVMRTHEIDFKGDTRPFNLTFSSALAENLIHIGQTYGFLHASTLSAIHLSHNVVINDIGSMIRVVINKQESEIEVQFGSEAAIPLNSMFFSNKIPSLTIHLADGSTLKKVQLRNGCEVTDGVNFATVTVVQGVTCVHVHSTTAFLNDTAHEIDLAVERSAGSTFIHSYVVKPAQTVYFPSQVVSSGRMMARIKGRALEFSQPTPILPYSKSDGNDFQMVMHASKESAAKSRFPTNVSSAASVMLEPGQSAKLFGFQSSDGYTTQITVTPAIIIENFLYTEASFKLESASDGTLVMQGQLHCGQHVDCFTMEPALTLSIQIPGHVYTDKIPVIFEPLKGIKKFFKKVSSQNLAIGVSKDGQHGKDSAPTNFVCMEKDIESSGCVRMCLFSHFWIVNHIPARLNFIHEKDEEHRQNEIPSYPQCSIQKVPLMMAGCEDLSAMNLRIALATTNFGDTLQLGKLEAGMSITVPQHGSGEFEIRLKVHRAAGRFARTKILSFLPQLVVVNNLDRDIFLRQNVHEFARQIPANSRILDFGWPDASKPKLIRASFSAVGIQCWSGVLMFNSLGEHRFTMPNPKSDNEPLMVDCVVKQRDNIIYAVFREGDSRFPPCRILNRTRFSFDISQKDIGSWLPVPPFSNTPFCWTEPFFDLLVDIRFNGAPESVKVFKMIAEITTSEEWTSIKANLSVEIKVDGPTSTMTIVELSVGNQKDSTFDQPNASLIEKQMSTVNSSIKFVQKRIMKELDALNEQRIKPSKMFITVIDAWDLPQTDITGGSDPYVEVHAGDSMVKTDVRNNQLQPHWNQELTLQIRDGISELLVIVWDKDTIKNEVVGGFTIKLSEFKDTTRVHQRFVIYVMNGNVPDTTKPRQGELRLILDWVRSAEALRDRHENDLRIQVAQYVSQLDYLTNELTKVQKRMKRPKDQRQFSVGMASTMQGMHRLIEIRRREAIAKLGKVRREKQRIIGGKFKVELLQAKQCLAMDASGTSDPYVKVNYAGTEYATKVHSKTLNPEWNQAFEFNVLRVPDERGLPLRLAMFDQDTASADDFMSEHVIFLNDFIDLPCHQPVQDWVPMRSLNTAADILFARELGESVISRGDLLIGFEWLEKDVESYDFDVSVQFNLPAIGISVVDSGYQREIMYLSVEQINFNCLMRNDFGDFSVFVSVDNIQIDNPDIDSGGGDTAQMVMLDTTRNADNGPMPMLQLSVMSEHVSDIFNYFPYASLLIQGLMLQTNTRWLSNTLWFVQHLVDLLFDGYQEERPPPLPVLEVMHVGRDSGKRLFFGHLDLSPLSFTVTLANSVDGKIERSTDFDWILKGAARLGLNSAPIRLNALMMTNELTTSDDLISNILNHYIKSGASSIGAVLLSSEFMGNPVQLIGSVGGGVKDFFYEPAAGAVLGPAAFGRGIMKGTVSLVSGTVGGVFNTASKLTGAVGKGIASMAMDSEYAADIERTQKQLAGQSAAKNLASGAKTFGKGLFSGVTGILADPIRGARRDGGKGFIKGVGTGLLGVISKPTAGAILFASATTGGVRNATSSVNLNNVKRSMLSRFPRPFYGIQGSLRSYASSDARGKFFLAILNNFRYRKDMFLGILDLPDGKSLIASDRRVLLVKLSADDAVQHKVSLNELWSLELFDLQALVTKDTLVFRNKGNKEHIVDLTQVPSSSLLTFLAVVRESELGARIDEDVQLESLENLDQTANIWPNSPISTVRLETDNSSSSLSKSNITRAQKLLIAGLEAEIQRIKTDIDAVLHSNLSLEVVVKCARLLNHKSNSKLYCQVYIEQDGDIPGPSSSSSAINLNGSMMKKTTGTSRRQSEEDFESSVSEAVDPQWNFQCHFTLHDRDRTTLCINVLKRAFGPDKELGRASFKLSDPSLRLDMMSSISLPLFKKDNRDENYGTIDIGIHLSNAQLVTLSAALEIAKYKHLVAIKAQNLPLEKDGARSTHPSSVFEFGQTDEMLTVVTDSNISDREGDSEDGHSHVQADEFEDEEFKLEQSLRRQLSAVHNSRIMLDTTLRDMNAHVQFELVQAHEFRDCDPSTKGPAMRLTARIGNHSFKSGVVSSWDPEWNMRFAIPMPHFSVPVKLIIRRKKMVGWKTTARIDIDFAELVRSATIDEGVWVPMFQGKSSKSIACDLLVRVIIKSEVLDELLQTENNVAHQLSFSSSH